MDQTNILKISIASTLCYLIFIKSYTFLNSILLWLSVHLRIESQAIIFSVNAVLYLVSIMIVVFIYNRVIRNKIPSIKSIWMLIVTITVLQILILSESHLYAQYIIDTNLEPYKQNYLFGYTWSITLKAFFTVTLLIVFMYKLYKHKNTLKS